MRTKEEIEHFIGFCQIAGDKFAAKIVNILADMSERELQSFRQTLNSCIADKKHVYLLMEQNH